MGTILWSPTWVPSPDFSVRRSYCDIFVIGWHNGVIIQSGQYTIIQEIPFGGFRYHLRFKAEFWNWSSSSWLFRDIFEDIYVTFPGSSTPVPADPSTCQYRVCDPIHRRGIVNDMVGVDRKYYFFAFPPAPDDYWAKSHTELPVLPMIYDPD